MDNIFNNTKIYVKDKSKEIQQKLFSLGYSWGKDSKDTIVGHLEEPFIYIYNKEMTYDNRMNYFLNHPNREITIEELLNYKPIQKVKLEPFQKVLARDSKNFEWRVDIFSNIVIHNIAFKFRCIGNLWAECIPYEGNEHLLGTKQDVEIEIIND